MRVVRKADKPKPIIQGLELLADFLSAIGPRTTNSQWKAFLKKSGPRGVLSGLFFDWVTNMKTKRTRAVPSVDLEEAKETRWWINNDLGFLRAHKKLEMPFSAVVFRLNELKLETGWQCFPLAGSPSRPGQAILRIRWADGSTGRWTAQSWPVTKRLKDSLYAILGGALVSGRLSNLKMCRECGKYVVVSDLKRQFCPDTNCKDIFHNREKSKKGTFKAYREHSRRVKISRAGTLKKQGVSIAKIQEETGLPQRVLDKLFHPEQ